MFIYLCVYIYIYVYIVYACAALPPNGNVKGTVGSDCWDSRHDNHAFESNLFP